MRVSFTIVLFILLLQCGRDRQTASIASLEGDLNPILSGVLADFERSILLFQKNWEPSVGGQAIPHGAAYSLLLWDLKPKESEKKLMEIIYETLLAPLAVKCSGYEGHCSVLKQIEAVVAPGGIPPFSRDIAIFEKYQLVSLLWQFARLEERQNDNNNGNNNQSVVEAKIGTLEPLIITDDQNDRYIDIDGIQALFQGINEVPKTGEGTKQFLGQLANLALVGGGANKPNPGLLADYNASFTAINTPNAFWGYLIAAQTGYFAITSYTYLVGICPAIEDIIMGNIAHNYDNSQLITPQPVGKKLLFAGKFYLLDQIDLRASCQKMFPKVSIMKADDPTYFSDIKLLGIGSTVAEPFYDYLILELGDVSDGPITQFLHQNQRVYQNQLFLDQAFEAYHPIFRYGFLDNATVSSSGQLYITSNTLVQLALRTEKDLYQLSNYGTQIQGPSIVVSIMDNYRPLLAALFFDLDFSSRKTNMNLLSSLLVANHLNNLYNDTQVPEGLQHLLREQFTAINQALNLSTFSAKKEIPAVKFNQLLTLPSPAIHEPTKPRPSSEVLFSGDSQPHPESTATELIYRPNPRARKHGGCIFSIEARTIYGQVGYLIFWGPLLFYFYTRRRR